MRVHLFVSLLLVAAGAATAGCDESLRSVAGPSPNLQPTFSSIQSEIFEKPDSAGRSACVTCHTNTGRPPSGGLNLNHDVAYTALVSVMSSRRPGAILVIPGDPDNSYLIHKLDGTNIAGRRMPFNGPPYLTDGQILIMKRWIAVGAPRN